MIAPVHEYQKPHKNELSVAGWSGSAESVLQQLVLSIMQLRG